MYCASRRELYVILKSKHSPKDQKCHLFLFLISKLKIDGTDQTNKQVAKIKQFVHKFYNDVQNRWKCANRYAKRFHEKFGKWLARKISFRINKTNAKGRPPNDFCAISKRTRLRRTKLVRDTMTADQLAFAACSQLRAEGRLPEAKLIQEAVFTSPNRSKKISDAWCKAQTTPSPSPYSSDEALALLLDADLTKEKYIVMQQGANRRNANLYPCYDLVRESKKRCYPSENCITVDETCARVTLQSLLDHTIKRIVMNEGVADKMEKALTHSQSGQFILTSKWGCDGSGGHSIYKQKTEDPNFNEGNVFVTCVVPLQLCFEVESTLQKIPIWDNPRPNSTLFCRPLHINIRKETSELIKTEINRVNLEISELTPSIVTVNNQELKVTSKLKMTMIDGKVCHVATNTASSQRCNVCGVLPSEANDIDGSLRRPVNPDALEYGLSTLHAWIRFMEYFLHVAYREPLKIYKCPARLKHIMDNTKKKIQAEFRVQLGLRIDEVRQGGGNSNDGNMARKFFKEAETTARILNLDIEPIQRCHTILQVLASGYDINIPKFEEYAVSTARLLVSRYGWYSMPPSVHKVLLHGGSIIGAAELPIGLFGEEALECRNKHLRSYKEKHSQKYSRVRGNRDVLNMLLASSDPYVYTFRAVQCKERSDPTEAMLELLCF